MMTNTTWQRIAQSAVLALAMVGGPITSAHADPMAIPDNLKVPAQNVQLLEAYATGVQIYVCKARADDPGAYEWTFKAPQADLWNDAGEKIGKHYAGPTWEANDGSTAVGEAIEHADAPDPGAIPWLLLKAKSNGGTGAFSTVTYVQRIETVGGVAPTDGCNQSTADSERQVEYKATYAFSYGAAK